MDVLTLIGIGVIGAVLSVTVKNYRPEIGILISLATGIVIFSCIASAIERVLEDLRQICENSGVDTEFFRVIIKVIAISYVTQFASELAKDAGEGAISKKLEMGGKALVLVSIMPVVRGVLDVIVNTLMDF